MLTYCGVKIRITSLLLSFFTDFKASFDLARCVAPVADSNPDLIKKPPNLVLPEELEGLLDEISKTGVTG